MKIAPIGMETVLEKFGDQIKEGYLLGEKIEFSGEIEEIIVSGMGGSALPGEILQSVLDKLKIPVIVSKDYNLPEFAGSKTLVFAISYSGNTEETIESFKEAWRKGCKVIVITSGGRLAELADEKKVPIILVPEGLPPRLAYGYQFFSILKVLENSEIIKSIEKDIEKTASIISKYKSFKERAEDFLEDVVEKIPIIYTSSSMKAVAYKWKINFNETSKKQAFYNVFPEMNHNELVGFMDECRAKKDFFVFFIKDEDENRKINKRIDFTKQIIKKQGIDTTEINLTGHSRLSKIFSAIYIGDWLAYLLAKKTGVDPDAVELIEELKKKMKKV